MYNEFMNKKTLYTLISLLVVFIIAVIVKVSFFSPNTNSTNVDLDAKKESEMGGSGYIKLPDNSNEEKKLVGKVISVNSSDNSKATHKLLDDKGNIVAFLVSDDDKLKLAEGRVVEVTGEVEKNTGSEFILLTVTAISFR